MSAIGSLRTAVRTLRRTPLLFGVAFAYGLALLPQTALQFLGVPLASVALQAAAFFVGPFALAGVVGLAANALDGAPVGVGSFVRSGKENYVRVLLGTILETAIVLVFVAAFVFGTIVVGVAAVGSGAGAEAVLPSVLAVALLAGVPYLVVAFFIQFFPVAIVVDDAGVSDAFARSYQLVRANLRSALGYSIVAHGVSLLLSAPVVAYVVYRSLDGFAGIGADAAAGSGAGPVPGMVRTALSPPEVAAVSVASLAATTATFAFLHTYAVAFFTETDRSSPNRVRPRAGRRYR
ncbi:DUF7847 domain-containing protein [Halegenticoccus tardaugens]|uniref:DUF7847 domain-containing protein n=1 Tax=Halegenticoccus tardaugens TaxID=2071624 RepID=UPI00100BC441|nr:hypothetical protein [Halegenticoccus tardaugens]